MEGALVFWFLGVLLKREGATTFDSGREIGYLFKVIFQEDFAPFNIPAPMHGKRCVWFGW